ncbi:putative high mobility group protein B1-like 1 [Camelus dromedarius]|uniref:Putative high mobility group protein B1-like 1 n=1 Tax=Camelus dromedarius TaxID=9838 RepID=A0A5N4D217_CAMDR|nr:putative high mobility group protein B1-like 1 [Camelus dromedarius]
MSDKEGGKFEDMAKADKTHRERDMKPCISPKGRANKKFKDPIAEKSEKKKEDEEDEKGEEEKDGEDDE